MLPKFPSWRKWPILMGKATSRIPIPPRTELNWYSQNMLQNQVLRGQSKCLCQLSHRSILLLKSPRAKKVTLQRDRSSLITLRPESKSWRKSTCLQLEQQTHILRYSHDTCSLCLSRNPKRRRFLITLYPKTSPQWKRNPQRLFLLLKNHKRGKVFR